MNAAIETFEALKSLPVNAAILDTSGCIAAVNDAWKEFARRNNFTLPNCGVGANYLKYCGSTERHRSTLETELRDLLAGRRDLSSLIYPCHSPTEKRWFCLIGMPLSLNEPAGIALLHVNLTDMLPSLIGARPIRVQPRQESVPSTAKLKSLGGVIERSVSEALSSQLSAMLVRGQTDLAGGQPPANDDAVQVLADARLSKRQIEVLRLIGKGKTNKEIATILFRSPNTIKLHVSAILQQLKLKSRTQAALLASRVTELFSDPPS